MELRSGYKNTEVGVIPEDWEVKLISECSLRITDGEHLTPQRTESGYYLLSARNILNGKIDTNDVDYVGKEEYMRIRQRCNPEYGDVLISCSGSIGRIATVPEDFECVMVRSAALVKPNYSKTTGLYIQYFLQSSIGQNQIFASMNQGAQPNLFLNHIQGLRIALPPTKAEQTAIATALSDADGLISSLEKLLTKKRNIKQGAMQRLLQPKEGWEVKKIKNLSEYIVVGFVGSMSTLFTKEGVPLLRGLNILPGSLDLSALKYISIETHKNWRKSNLAPGDLVMVRVGYPGTTTVIPNGLGDLNAASLVIVRPNKKIIDANYLCYYLNSNKGQLEIQNRLVGGAQQVFNTRTASELEIPLPQFLSEQIEIATILSDMDAEIAALETKLEKYRKIKLGMMQNLLTGKIRLI